MQARSGSRRRAALERFAREGGHAGPSGAPEAPWTEAAAKLRERLATLPADYAEPLLLRLVHDLSYARIAEILDLPETTVENRIVRGRRLLREQAAADLGLDDHA
jgi:DNA-directed RNA polymerase specialized sigma24 family protein